MIVRERKEREAIAWTSHSAKVVIACGGREGGDVSVPGVSQTKGMDEEQRWKETLLWREGG